MRSIKLSVTCLVATIFLLAGSGLAGAEPSGKLIIFHAGSLSVPFAKMEKIFEKKHPGVDIVRKAGGSTKIARLIADKGETADIMASADYVVIDKTLIPNFASWDVRFATNQMVLCYTDKSKFSKEINRKNWYEILGRKGVVWGHSEPNLDPCGYRSLMVLQLAEKFYKLPGLYQQLIDNRPAKNVRPKAVELIALLKSGKMDYAWEYRSVAVQHGLKFVPMDKHINLGDYKLTPFYKQAVVEVSGKKPGTKIKRVGKSITYGITMLNSSPNKEAAEAFLMYLFSPDGGLKILEELGQPPFSPVRVSSKKALSKMPKRLTPLVEIRN
jgi:molybdate/tungstate transport system substrate-binding protein